MDDSSNPLHPSQADEQTAAAQRLQFAAATIVLALLYSFLWFLRAPYKGIEDDGMLYELQAMARAMLRNPHQRGDQLRQADTFTPRNDCLTVLDLGAMLFGRPDDALVTAASEAPLQ